MDLGDYIRESVFEDKYTYLFNLIWENFEEDGFVITDEENNEIDCIFKAVAIQNLIGEFIYRLYDEVNETDFETVVKSLADLGIGEEAIIEYCENNDEIDVEEDPGSTIKNGLDYTTQIVADKLLDMFTSTDIFDYFFTATYDFEQDFTFAFEDTDEFLSFVDSNQDKLDEYKEEYISVLNWVDSGMVV